MPSLLAILLVTSGLGCGEAREPETTSAETPSAAEAPPESAAPAQPAPPTDLGPPKRVFAKRFVVNVRTGPSREAFRVGYMRGGAVLATKNGTPASRDGCPRGWYELETGGFVCSGRDVTVFEGERLPERPAVQPDRTAKLPYQYGSVRRQNVPMYRRLPTDEEAAQYEGFVIPGAAPAETIGEGVAAAVEPAPEAAPEPAAPEAPIAEAATLVATAPSDAVPAEDAQPTLGSLLGEEGSVLARRMMKGFNVSLDREMRSRGRRYWRTQSNGYIPEASIALVHGSDFQGVVLAEHSWQLPVAFTLSSRTQSYAMQGERLRRGETPGYHFAFPVLSEATVRSTDYFVDDQARYYRVRDVSRVAARPRPEGVAANEKWIDVDLDTQTLVAYEGDAPVYVTLISSGKPDEELEFATPTGDFRITSKHLATSMDGDHATDGPYSIEDVPYVMYFELAYALHSAFWHNAFGRPRSHGCVNLSPLDARWVFDWSEPHLPQGWHGVYPSEDVPGTRIFIHGEARYR